MQIYAPPNSQPIVEVYAFLSVDSGGDGVVARKFGDTMMPMVVTTDRLLDAMKVEAGIIARETGKRIVLARFASREDLWRSDG